MSPQHPQSPKDRAARAAPIGRTRPARPDDRWTGRSLHSHPPNPQPLLRPASAGNASGARRPSQANNNPWGAGRDLDIWYDTDTCISSPSTFRTPGTANRAAASTPVTPSPARNLSGSGASLPIPSSGTSPIGQSLDAAIQSLVREQSEMRYELRQIRIAILSLTGSVHTALAGIGCIREDLRSHSPVPPSGTHSTSTQGATASAPPMVVDPATIEAEFEDLMKRSVRELALASSLFLRISREYISRAGNPPPNATAFLEDAVDAQDDLWGAVHGLARTSQADRQRLYDLTGSSAHVEQTKSKWELAFDEFNFCNRQTDLYRRMANNATA